MAEPLWTSSEIAAATGGRVGGEFVASTVHFDSRLVGSGALFVALPGEVADGHEFVASALERGAAGALVQSDYTASVALEPRLIRVANVAQALDDLAQAARARMSGVVIGITGSAGKTGTKDALYRAIGRSGFVHASEKSFNNHVGVPISLVRMPQSAQYGIFELGMNAPGEIGTLAAMVQPDIAIVTSIGLAHRAGFEKDEDIAHAKAEIFDHVTPGGSIIFAKECKYLDILMARAKSSAAARIVTTSLQDDQADVYAERIVYHDTCTCMTARVFDKKITFKVAQPGQHLAANSLNVLAAVYLSGADLALAGVALGTMQAIHGRGRRYQVNMGDQSIVVIDESYNANPLSMAASLKVLAQTRPQTRAGRRVAVLGDMEELGSAAEKAHMALADKIIDAGVSQLFAFGPKMTRVAEHLHPRVKAEGFIDKNSLMAALRQQTRPGDVIMVKGSNAQGMDEVVAMLLALEETSDEGRSQGLAAHISAARTG